ncbi:rRNA maturation RNase YbeY [Thiolapillus sp.]
MNPGLEIQLASKDKDLPANEDLGAWARLALGEDAADAGIVIRIVDEEESRQLNHKYRGRDASTNVLSFPFAAPPGVPVNHIGDLVICAPVVRAEADAQGKPLLHHWAHMIVHGVLHLRGYEHTTNEDAERMEFLERKLLQRMGIPDPYSETE